MPTSVVYLLIVAKRVSLILCIHGPWLTVVFGAQPSDLLAPVHPCVTPDDSHNNRPRVSSLDLHTNFCLWTKTFPDPWAFATIYSPATPAVAQSLHQGALFLITVLCTLLEVFVHVHFLGKHLSSSGLPKGHKFPMALSLLLLFVHSHILSRHLFYFSKALTRGCNYFWALLCQIALECPSLPCACGQRLYSFTYELSTNFLCKPDGGQLHFCCTKVLAAQVLSAAGGE